MLGSTTHRTGGVSILEAFLLSLGVIFVAELGDKSQLMALAFATRYSALTVLAGISVATLIVHAGSVLIGRSLASVLPYDAIAILGALSFFAFALWTLRGDSLSEGEEAKPTLVKGRAVLAVGVAFFLAELGDKTMLATVALGTREEPIGTWLGSTVGMVLADALAIGVGVILGTRLPERAIRYGAALAFAIFGALLLASVLIK
ncbi:MAG: Ca2+/H+ antiporter, family [Chloroflexota bacterium]|jgi:putative Ca2+/H+ antiporter (TMEM165/GDT1 family)|nr:Ca2+/H+ antiporter, family [Chloroflexota bacterium]